MMSRVPLKVDKFRNHVDQYYDICPDTCKVDNCPIGYTRLITFTNFVNQPQVLITL